MLVVINFEPISLKWFFELVATLKQPTRRYKTDGRIVRSPKDELLKDLIVIEKVSTSWCTKT